MLLTGAVTLGLFCPLDTANPDLHALAIGGWVRCAQLCPVSTNSLSLVGVSHLDTNHVQLLVIAVYFQLASTAPRALTFLKLVYKKESQVWETKCLTVGGSRWVY